MWQTPAIITAVILHWADLFLTINTALYQQVGYIHEQVCRVYINSCINIETTEPTRETTTLCPLVTVRFSVVIRRPSWLLDNPTRHKGNRNDAFPGVLVVLCSNKNRNLLTRQPNETQGKTEIMSSLVSLWFHVTPGVCGRSSATVILPVRMWSSLSYC